MLYHSTRQQGPEPQGICLSQALRKGLAPDGGLYVPQAMPRLSPEAFEGLRSLPAIAARLLAPFFEGDALAPELGQICQEALDCPIVLNILAGELHAGQTGVLELFWGPTAAFKDFGARFLARALVRLEAPEGTACRERTILVATSGDTGGAVAAAFHGLAGLRVVVLYPLGRISPMQEQQLTCWGDNVTALAVRTGFDGCQDLVKAAFAARAQGVALSSANSINIGRLLPQMSYYAWASLHWHRHFGRAPGFIVPSGNLGNALACLWAREMGLPIGDVVLATNANTTVLDYWNTGQWQPRATLATLANAMDVGNPSNMERLRVLYPTHDQVRGHLEVHAIDDDAIARQIREGLAGWPHDLCPHTATAVAVLNKLRVCHGRRHGMNQSPPTRDWIVAATAHAAKFDETVAPLTGHPTRMPQSLRMLMERPTSRHIIDPELAQLLPWLGSGRPDSATQGSENTTLRT